MEKVEKILANVTQGLTSTEQAQARVNINAQASLVAGANVTLDPTTNTISATDTTYSAGSGLALTGTTFSNTAPNVKADWDAAAGSDAEILNKPTIPDDVYIFQDYNFDRTAVKAAWNAHKVVQMYVYQDNPPLRYRLTKLEQPDADTEVYHFTAIAPVFDNAHPLNPEWRLAEAIVVYSIQNDTFNYYVTSCAAAVNDPTITFQQNGSTIGTFTLNQKLNQTISFQTPVTSNKLAQATGSSSSDTYLDFSLALPREQQETSVFLFLDLFSLGVTYGGIDRSITQYFDSVDFYLGNSSDVARFNFWHHDFGDPWPNGVSSKGRIATQHLGGSFVTSVDRVTIRLNKTTGADLTGVTANGAIYIVQH